MRSINVSTDVFAAIWAVREAGEDTEDAILARVLRVKPTPDAQPAQGQIQAKIGFIDARNGVELPDGFEIFRTYKGKEYKAVAENGQFRLNADGKEYPTLNQLSRATSGNIENAWRNWYYTGQDGKRHLIENLRGNIRSRPRWI
jgi:hypothetical protein